MGINLDCLILFLTSMHTYVLTWYQHYSFHFNIMEELSWQGCPNMEGVGECELNIDKL